MKKIYTLAMLLFCSDLYAAGAPFTASNYLYGAADAWSQILPGGGGGEIAARIQPMQTSDAMQFANFISLLAYNDTAFTIFESDAHMSRALDFLARPMDARRRACPAGVSGCANVRRSLVVDGDVGASFADYSPSNNSDFKTKTTNFNMRARAFVSDGTVFGVEYTRTDTDNRDSAIDINATGNSVTMFAQYLSKSGIFVGGGINAGTIAWKSDKTIVSVPDDDDYNTNFWGGQVNTGVQVISGAFTMSPEIGMRYMHVSAKSHVDAATQFFEHWRYDSLRANAGATVGYDFAGGGFAVRPTLTAGGTYDIISHAPDNIAVRIAGDKIYRVPVRTPGRAGFAGGAGIGVYTARFSAGLDWNIDIRSDYVAHTGMAHAKIVF